MEGVLCFKYQRTVAKDNTVRLGEHTLQLLPGPYRYSYSRARVEIQERLDGSLVVAYRGKVIASREAPPLPAVLRARKGLRGQHPGKEKGKVGEPIVPFSYSDPRIPQPRIGETLSHKPGP